MGNLIQIAGMIVLSWVILGIHCNPVEEHTTEMENITKGDKDMYVIHATVYEVGILSNKTDNTTSPNNTWARESDEPGKVGPHHFSVGPRRSGRRGRPRKRWRDDFIAFNSDWSVLAKDREGWRCMGQYRGQQESVTFFHSNGSQVDLGALPQPLLTNVTAHSVVGVAPVDSETAGQVGDRLRLLPSLQHPTEIVTSDIPVNEAHSIHKRSFDAFIQRLFKRAANSTLAKVTKGSAVIPPEVGVHSIALPPLLSLNNNLSNIPVPIPNTSVVKYAKVNTLIRTP